MPTTPLFNLRSATHTPRTLACLIPMLALLFVACFPGTCTAQCEPTWLPGEGVPGTNGTVHDIELWDPDGPGPTPELVVVAGSFSVAGRVAAGNIAAWNGQEWITLGGSANARIYALTLDDQNRLVVGGDFTAIGGIETGFIARCGPLGWESVGGGVSGTVRSLARMPNGGIVAAGSFTHAGGNLVNRVAAWDGSSWKALDGGFGSTVSMVTVRPNDEIVALSVGFLSRWNGTAWTNLNGPLFIVSVQTLATGDLIAGTSGTGVHRWNGSTWTQLGGPNFKRAFLELPGGQLLAAGQCTTGSSTCIHFWNGATWTPWRPIGQQGSEVLAFRVATDGSFIAGGTFTPSATTPCAYVAFSDGQQWRNFGTGTNLLINQIIRLPSGHLAACGYFGEIGGVTARRVAIWDGVTWRPLGAGANNTVFALAGMHDGSIVAGGLFSEIGGVTASRVARFHQGVWSAMPGMGPGSVTGLVVQNNALIANGNFPLVGTPGNFCVAKWDDTSWSPVGDGIPQPSTGAAVSFVLPLPNGELLAGGSFQTQLGAPADRLARWDGMHWSLAGGWVAGSVSAGIVRANGDILVSASDPNAFSPSSWVARWNGSGWTPFLPSPVGGVLSYAETPDGSLLIAGEFQQAGTSAANRVALWDGLAWHALGDGLDNIAHSVVAVNEHEIAAGGRFMFAGDELSAYFARYTFTNIPWIALHPTPFTTTPTLPVTLSATAAVGYDNLTFQWQRETAPGSNQWTNLTDGPGGASASGGTVSGATGTVNGGQPALCTITNLQLSDAGNYRCVISNPCGQDESNPALISITNPCPPDLTTSAIPASSGYGTPNGTLNNDDFFYYLQQFVAGNLAVADLTTTAIPGQPGYGVPNGAVTNDDFFYYLILFSTGC